MGLSCDARLNGPNWHYSQPYRGIGNDCSISTLLSVDALCVSQYIADLDANLRGQLFFWFKIRANPRLSASKLSVNRERLLNPH